MKHLPQTEGTLRTPCKQTWHVHHCSCWVNAGNQRYCKGFVLSHSCSPALFRQVLPYKHSRGWCLKQHCHKKWASICIGISLLALGKGWGCFGCHQWDALCKPCRYCKCCPGPSPSRFWFLAALCPSDTTGSNNTPNRGFFPNGKRGFQGVRDIYISSVDQLQSSPPTAHPTAIINLCPSPPCPSPAGTSL